MDDLYNNAWGDSSDFYGTTQPATTTSPAAAWTSPVLSPPPQDEEADLATPSWSTGADIKWSEPSEQSHGFAWSSTEPDLAWGTSTYADITLGKADAQPAKDDAETTGEDEEIDLQAPETKSSIPDSSIPDSPVDQPIHVEVRVSPPLSPKADPRSPSPDQDGFGTFEDASAFEETPYVGTPSPGLEDDAWGSPWASAPAEEDSDEEAKPVDEWELARRNKERLDRMVPPEVLANIVSQCEEYFREISAKDDEKAKPKSSEEPWMNDWHSGIEGIEGLETLMQKLVPDLTLQPPVQFTKTGIAKHMASTVRVTKNLPLSKASPMSHYLAARGSTAWETAIKQRKEVIEEDVVPVGWRIVEKQQQAEADSPTNAKPSGGFFSFWSKRQSKTPTPSVASPKEVSPSRSSTSGTPAIPSSEPEKQSPRPSLDSVHSRSMSSDKERQASPAPDLPVRTPSVDILATSVPTPSPPQPSSSYADAPEPSFDNQTPSPQAPPSAVSRFLNRFSRKRSSLGASSPRSSLALSSDDLEFLSDIVPSAADGHDEDGYDFKALNEVLKPEPLPPILAPPPLAPPPRPSSSTLPSPTTAPIASGSILGNFGQPPLPAPQSQPSQPDLDDVFGDFETSPSPTSQSSGMSPSGSVPAMGSGVFGPSRPLSPHITGPQTRTSSPSPLTFATLVPTRTESPAGGIPTPIFPPNPSVTIITSAPSPSPSPSPAPLSTTDSEMARKHPLPALAPLSFLPPPGASSPGQPSSSEIPLAELYPEAAARQQALQMPPPPQPVASTSSAASAPSRPTSSFAKPSYQPPRSNTPIMSRAPTSPPPAAPLLAPPPKPSVPAPLPATALFGGDDDDDFADFQSSAPVASNPPPSSSSSFSLPPPPPSATTKPSIPLAPILPPPPSFASLHASSSTPQPLSADPLSDDFGAMLLASFTSLDSARSRGSGFDSSFHSDQSLLTPQKSSLSFDDFLASPASGLRTPSPPRPLSKSPRPALALQPPKAPAKPHPILSPQDVEARASSHQRTLSLMERAAARPGQWPAPAPPSPLPQTGSFPILGAPAPASAAKPNVDLLGDDDGFGAFQSDSGAKPSSPPQLAGTRESTPSLAPQAWTSFAPISSNLTPAIAKPVGHASQKSGGGLSAQDLSFFEGL